MIGLVFGLTRLIWEFSYTIPTCGEVDPRPFVIKVNYLYFALFLWVICTISTVIISLATKRDSDMASFSPFAHGFFFADLNFKISFRKATLILNS
jgi:sodium/glucose cotransporter 9